MSIISGTAKSAGGFYDFPIEQSLRFDGTSTLTRTPTQTSNLGTWTSSFWIKRSTLNASTQSVFDARPSSSLSNNNLTNQYFVSSDDSFKIGGYSTDWRETTAVYRDLSSWYHFVVSFDISTGTKSISIYVNGDNVSSFSVNSNPTGTTGGYNQQNPHTIGGCCNGSASFRGYLANIQFLDGTVPTTSNGGLDASTGELKWFGETKSGVWIPKAYTGSYGTNGFHLTFEDGIESLSVEGYTGSVNAFRDKSGNNKHWKIN